MPKGSKKGKKESFEAAPVHSASGLEKEEEAYRTLLSRGASEETARAYSKLDVHLWPIEFQRSRVEVPDLARIGESEESKYRYLLSQGASEALARAYSKHPISSWPFRFQPNDGVGASWVDELYTGYYKPGEEKEYMRADVEEGLAIASLMDEEDRERKRAQKQGNDSLNKPKKQIQNKAPVDSDRAARIKFYAQSGLTLDEVAAIEAGRYAPGYWAAARKFDALMDELSGVKHTDRIPREDEPKPVTKIGRQELLWSLGWPLDKNFTQEGIADFLRKNGVSEHDISVFTSGKRSKEYYSVKTRLYGMSRVPLSERQVEDIQERFKKKVKEAASERGRSDSETPRSSYVRKTLAPGYVRRLKVKMEGRTPYERYMKDADYYALYEEREGKRIAHEKAEKAARLEEKRKDRLKKTKK